MDKYRDFVATCAESSMSGPSELIFNRSASHAGVIVEQLFKRAHRSASLLTERLDPSVYGTEGVVDAAIDFLRSRNGYLRILVEKPEEINSVAHPLLAEIWGSGLWNKIEIRAVPKDIRNLYKFNFAVIDGRSYRFEKDRAHFEAVAQFGDAVLAPLLSERFEGLWGKSPVTDLEPREEAFREI